MKQTDVPLHIISMMLSITVFTKLRADSVKMSQSVLLTILNRYTINTTNNN